MSNLQAELNDLLRVKYKVTVNDVDNYEIYWRKL